MNLLMLILAAGSVSVVFLPLGYLVGILHEAYAYRGDTTITHIRRVETTCIHCRRMRKFTRRGIYR